MKSWKRPTPNQVDRAVALLGRSGHYRYFFNRLENPEWIKPLREKGFFINPPPPDRDEERGSIGFPPWPESHYLSRMASLQPELVRDIILDLPDTENVRVLEDLMDAALVMPPEVSVKLVDKTKVWARLPYQHLLPEKLVNYVLRLLSAGKVDAGLSLVRIVFEIFPDPKRQEGRDEEDYSLPTEPRSRIDLWEYEELLKESIPGLVERAGVKAFDFLCDLLQNAIVLSLRDAKQGESEDYSYIWRLAIEADPEGHQHALKSILVSSIRDTAEALIQADMSVIRGLVERLERRGWCVFYRIALNILRVFPNEVYDLIAQRITDRDQFDETYRWPEYVLLLRDCFDLMSPPDQEIIIEWIKKGPDLEEYRKTEEQFTGKRPTDVDARRHQKEWRLERLSWFKENLPVILKDLYKELVTELGEPEHREFTDYPATWIGPTSPKNGEELQEMTVAEIVDFCRTWEPPTDPMSPSPEGFGRVLSSVVVENPARFAEQVNAFIGLAPTYVRAVLSGLREALGKGVSFDWRRVLELCEWVLAQPTDLSSRNRAEDTHWGWTRKTVADLLENGFKKETGGMPFEFREPAWKILQPLTDDPEPTPEYEEHYGGTNMDPTTLSINTTRGEAMHAVLQYALWVHRHLKKEPNHEERLARGFKEMLEVREVFDIHLDILRDPSLAIRSVYGQYFPWLVLIDSEWAKKNTEQIFPREETKRPFWKAAWNAYILWCIAYDGIFDILKPYYDLAIELMSETEEEESIRDPARKLGEHLMAFYWRGKLDFEKPKGFFDRFWEKASPSIRGGALAFLGHSLCNEKGSVPQKVLDRLRVLWERRLSLAEKEPSNEDFVQEMKAFGWSFVSGKFDNKWAIDKLLKVLRITQEVDSDHRVIERLASLSEEMPLETIQCLEYLVRGDREGWRMHGWRKHARTILSSTIQKEGKISAAARDLVHLLGSRGYLEFRNLLHTD